MKEYSKEQIGAKLKDIRAKAGVSRSKVSRAINKPEITIVNWETGKNVPSVISIATLLDYYEELLGEQLDMDTIIGRIQ